MEWEACERVVAALRAEGCGGAMDDEGSPRAWVEGTDVAGPWVALFLPNLIGTFWGREVEGEGPRAKQEWVGDDTEGRGISFGPVPDDQSDREIARYMIAAVKEGGNR